VDFIDINRESRGGQEWNGFSGKKVLDAKNRAASGSSLPVALIS
jgi:hypothetical protein